MKDPLLAALDPHTNAMVRACAGSGKTWLLTARIIRILLADPDLQPGGILAITFTRKAAAEIEARVLEHARTLHAAGSDLGLDELLAQIGIDNPDEALRRRARQLYRICLLSRPALAVSTFHSWYAHLRRGFNWMTHSAGGSRVEEGDELQFVAFGRLLAAGCCVGPLSRLAATVSVDALMQLLRSATENRLAFAAGYGKLFSDPGAIEQCVDDFENELVAGAGLQALAEDDGFDGWLKDLYEFFTGKEMAATADAQKFCAAFGEEPGIGRIRALREVLYTKAGGKRKSLATKVEGRHIYDAYSKVCAALDQAEQIEQERLAASFNADALAVVREYFHIYEQVKREEGAADFNDLEFEIWRQLADPDAATLLAERIDSQYRHILVDEFQDTSMPQWQIIRSWLDSAVSTERPPSIFIVGDDKQSIFGWRGARPEIMVAAENFLQARYRLRTFATSTTRRCPAAVVEVLNATFEPPPPAEEKKQVAAGKNTKMAGFSRHQTLKPPGSGAVIVLPVPIIEKPPQADAAGQLRDSLLEPPPPDLAAARAASEAEALARFIDAAIGSWLIDEPAGGKRPCRPEDVLVLFRSRTHLDALARALLGRGIPCSLPQARLQVATLECADLIALMNAICNPDASACLLQALRCPVFGCSEEDLIAVHLAGGGRLGTRSDAWRGLRRAARERPATLSRPRRLLDRWRRLYLQRRLPAHEILARVYRDGQVIERYVHSLPPEIAATCVRNLEWVLNYAIERRSENVGLYGYVRQLMKMRAQGLSEPAGAEAPAKAAGAVRLMTVHAAKGLEAPIVALAQAHFENPLDSPQALVGWQAAADSPDHFSLSRGRKYATEAQLHYWQQSEQAEAREQDNLLYVAMTRASQTLIVCAHQRSRAGGTNWHARIEEALRFLRAQPNEQGRLVHGKIDSGPAGDFRPADAAAQASPAMPAAEPEKRGQLLDAQSEQARRGELMHNLIALLLAGIADEKRLRFILAVDRDTLAALHADALRMLDSPRFAQLRDSADAIELELPVVAADGTRLLRIDCLLEFEDAVWIVDFKSPPGALAEDYRDQLIGYRDALAAGGETRRIGMAVLSGDGRFTEL